MIIEFFPIFAFFIFLKFRNLDSNNFWVSLTFFSLFFLASNFDDMGSGIHVYRYIHKFIGLVLIISLGFYIFKNKISIHKDNFVQLLSLFGIAILFSYFENPTNSDFYIYLRNFVFTGLVSVAIYFLVDTREKLFELATLIVKLGVLLSALGLVDYFILLYKQSQNFMDLASFVFARINTVQENPNFFGFIILFSMLFLKISRVKHKPIYYIMFILMIILSASRSIILGAFVVFIIEIYSYFKNHLEVNFNKIATAFIIFLLFLFIVFSSFVKRSENMSTARLDIASIAINILQENPFNGIGYGQFKTKYFLYADEDYEDTYSNEMIWSIKSHKLTLDELRKQDINLLKIQKMTHNDLLTIISELGFIGVLFSSIIIWQTYVRYKAIKDQLISNLSFNLFIVLFAFSMFHNSINSPIFWFIFSIPFILERISKLKKSP